MSQEDVGRTMLRRVEQHRDRWSSYGGQTGLTWLSEKLSPGELREFEIFKEFQDGFLERLSPDVAVAAWDKNAVLFEEGSYIDLAFFIVDGEVELHLGADPNRDRSAEMPIFDKGRGSTTVRGREALDSTVQFSPQDIPSPEEIASERTAMVKLPDLKGIASNEHRIPLLSTLDFDLPMGGTARLGPGEIFGEIGALSGWPQSVTVRTVTPCRLLQIRLPALRRLKKKSKGLKEKIDQVYRGRSLVSQLRRTPLFSTCDRPTLQRLAAEVDLVSAGPDDILVRQGEPAEALYLVRSGFIKLQQRLGDGEVAVSYLSKGMTLGEVELLVSTEGGWLVSAVSVEYSELVRIPRQAFEEILSPIPEVQDGLWQVATERIRETGRNRRDISGSQSIQIALDTGLVEGSSVLVIDLEACTRCDDCVRACATTHDGRPRFVREGGKVGNLLITRSCFHCRDPVCLVGCPTGAIHRAGIGEVVEVSEEICIGCSTCANNCPYDAIVMHETGETWPGDMVPVALRGQDRLLASKCDLCSETGHGPACVSNCPQGCAYRVGSVEEFHGLFGENQ